MGLDLPRGPELTHPSWPPAARWCSAGRDRTTRAGYYALHIRPREGTYRARVLERTLASGDICEAATSEKRVYR